jgi:transposase
MTMRWDKVLKETNDLFPKKRTLQTIDQLLRKLYCYFNYSTSQIATICDCNPSTIKKKLVQLNIKLKGRGGPNRKSTLLITEEDYRMLSLKELAKKYSCHPSTVVRLTKKYRTKA